MAVKLEHLADEIIQTDFLVVGGGMAGCTAALRARKKGNIDVAIMEKAAINYSGETGFDDFNFTGNHAFGDWDLIEHLINKDSSFAKQLKVLGLLEEIGVKVREDDGTLKVKQTGQQVGGPTWNRLVPDTDGKFKGDKVYYRGTDVKERLAAAVIKSGVRVFPRTMLTGLMTKEGIAVGATGVNIRTGKFLVFKAKAVLMSTGGIIRMYPYPNAPFPNCLFYGRTSPTNHGGGAAAAYRAGAKLVNPEFLSVYILGVGVSSGIGGGWFWDMQNSKGEFLEEKYPERSCYVVGSFSGTHTGGTGCSGPQAGYCYAPSMEAPLIERDVITFDRSQASDDEVIGCYFTAATEQPRSLKLFKLLGGIKNGPPTELRAVIHSLGTGTGILTSTDMFETTIKNLFVAGVAAGAGTGGAKLSGAMAQGFAVGDHIRERALEIKRATVDGEQLKQVHTEKKRVFAPLEQKGDVVDPLELEDQVRRINADYIGIHKTEPRLKRAVELLKVAKKKFAPALAASNPHELMRVLEVQDIIELSELHAKASLLRTESRKIPDFYRIDYPDQDDKQWQNVVITVQKVAGKAKYALEKL